MTQWGRQLLKSQRPNFGGFYHGTEGGAAFVSCTRHFSTTGKAKIVQFKKNLPSWPKFIQAVQTGCLGCRIWTAQEEDFWGPTCTWGPTCNSERGKRQVKLESGDQQAILLPHKQVLQGSTSGNARRLQWGLPRYWYRGVPPMGRLQSLKCFLSITSSQLCSSGLEDTSLGGWGSWDWLSPLLSWNRLVISSMRFISSADLWGEEQGTPVKKHTLSAVNTRGAAGFEGTEKLSHAKPTWCRTGQAPRQ